MEATRRIRAITGVKDIAKQLKKKNPKKFKSEQKNEQNLPKCIQKNEKDAVKFTTLFKPNYFPVYDIILQTLKVCF